MDEYTDDNYSRKVTKTKDCKKIEDKKKYIKSQEMYSQWVVSNTSVRCLLTSSCF